MRICDKRRDVEDIEDSASKSSEDEINIETRGGSRNGSQRGEEQSQGESSEFPSREQLPLALKMGMLGISSS